MQEITTKATALGRLRATACAAEGCETFAELATVALVRQFLRKGRRADAKRLLAAYLERYPRTGKIIALQRQVL